MPNPFYEIHIKGHLARGWADWLENMQMCCLDNGEMSLCGMLPDQAALMGVLNKLNCLNLAILSVNRTDRKCWGKTESNEAEKHFEKCRESKETE